MEGISQGALVLVKITRATLTDKPRILGGSPQEKLVLRAYHSPIKVLWLGMFPAGLRSQAASLPWFHPSEALAAASLQPAEERNVERMRSPPPPRFSSEVTGSTSARSVSRAPAAKESGNTIHVPRKVRDRLQ